MADRKKRAAARRAAPRLPDNFTGPCNAKCRHVDRSGARWPHNVRVQEDRGEIHTDDCGFWSREALRSDRDPGDFCTAGFPGIACRVFSRAKDLPPAPVAKSARAASAPKRPKTGAPRG